VVNRLSDLNNSYATETCLPSAQAGTETLSSEKMVMKADTYRFA